MQLCNYNELPPHPPNKTIASGGLAKFRTDKHILFDYETVSNKQFEVVNLQGSVTDQFED